ncbi:hypothetical protein [Weissella paramesenteroides]|uniref:hypothetical protein n=1 Tax=Weissella paramesenteroides TaxID=1249 RepID=UPI00376F3083
MGEKYERQYAKFADYYTQGWSIEKIAKHMGKSQERLKSGDYRVRYRKEHDIAQSRPKDEFKIDTKKMFELIHILESRYNIDSWENGYKIHFDDAHVPDYDPQMIELRRVVNGK